MPVVKKREKDRDIIKKMSLIDQELFLQAFERPTKIYRFLGERHITKPIFLLRNLYYMKDRMSRSNKFRKTFKIDSLLNTKLEKVALEQSNVPGMFLNLIFAGYYDGTGVSKPSEIRTFIHKNNGFNKNNNKKEKFSKENLFGVSKLMNNTDKMSNFSILTIPYKSLFSTNETALKQSKLIFRMEIIPENSEPKDDANYAKIYCSEIELKTINSEEGEYTAPIYLYEKDSSANGENYVIKWEPFSNDKDCSNNNKIFEHNCYLKFFVKWSNAKLPNPLSKNELLQFTNLNENLNNSKKSNSKKNDKDSSKQLSISKNKDNGSNIKCISYTFMYSNNTRQQTEETTELVCPFCVVDCKNLYILIKHLKLCHDRFNFTFTPSGNIANIDITLNDSYDGTYSGSPHDVLNTSVAIFPRKFGPVRRTIVTNLLVCKPPKKKPCLSEFLEHDDDEINNQRSYIVGHNRLYHHTETCLPVHPKEIDIDSEGENDPLWLQQKTIQMIDDFTDVNEGEKELIKMWNLHVMKNGYVGDCQLPIACDMFVTAKGKEIIEKNLFRNFVLHLCSLFDYGLISPEIIYKSIQKLKNILSSYQEGQKIISKRREDQLQYWLSTGKQRNETQTQISTRQQITATKNDNTTPEKNSKKSPNLKRRASSTSPASTKDQKVERVSKRRLSVVQDKDHLTKRRKISSTSSTLSTNIQQQTGDKPNRLMTRRQSMACHFSSKSKC